MSDSKRRANWQGMNWIRQEKRLAIYIRDNFTCQHCGYDLRTIQPGDGLRIELDHVLPVSRGGDNQATNLITSCSKCNLRRSDALLEEFHRLDGMRPVYIRRNAQKPINVALAKQILAERKAKRATEVNDD